jgi:hypothetical protein
VTDEEWAPLEPLAAKMDDALRLSSDLCLTGGSAAVRAHVEYEIAKREFKQACDSLGVPYG